MKLPDTDKYISKGIKMQKLIHSGSYGLFNWSSPTYDYKTVYDLEEAVHLNASEGWEFVNYAEIFHNLTLYLWRDLKKNKEK